MANKIYIKGRECGGSSDDATSVKYKDTNVGEALDALNSNLSSLDDNLFSIPNTNTRVQITSNYTVPKDGRIIFTASAGASYCQASISDGTNSYLYSCANSNQNTANQLIVFVKSGYQISNIASNNAKIWFYPFS